VVIRVTEVSSELGKVKTGREDEEWHGASVTLSTL